jgi:hypothetical protein
MTNNFSWTILDFDSTPKLQSAELLPYDRNNHYNADCYTSQGDLIAEFGYVEVEISLSGDIKFHLHWFISKKKCFYVNSSVIFHIDFWLYSRKNNSYARFWLINCTLSSAMYDSGKLINCGGNAEIIKKWNDFVPGVVSCIRF